MEKRAVARRQSASASVSDALRSRILSGELSSGNKIPSEMALCEIYGVSRVSVRSAIQQLKGEGLLESRQGEGTFVSLGVGLNNMSSLLPGMADDQHARMDLFEFRRIMEVESVGLAANRVNAEMVRRMDAAVAGMRNATEAVETAQWDLNFHELIAEATENPYIIEVFAVFKDAYFDMLLENVHIMGSNGAHFHNLICRAIEIRDVALAKSYMSEHLTDTIRRTISKLRQEAISEATNGELAIE